MMQLISRNWFLTLLLALLAMGMGCGLGGGQEQTIKTDQPAAIEMAKTILQGYADGKPVESEVMRFDQIIEDAKEEDAEKAAILERGLREIEGMMKKPAGIPKKAKAILAELEGG